MRTIIFWIFYILLRTTYILCNFAPSNLLTNAWKSIVRIKRAIFFFPVLFHFFLFFLITSLTWHALPKVTTLLVTINAKGKSNQWNKHLSIAGGESQYPSRRLDLPAKVSFVYNMFSELDVRCSFHTVARTADQVVRIVIDRCFVRASVVNIIFGSRCRSIKNVVSLRGG